MQRKDALPVLFLYLRSTNAFKSAYVVLLSWREAQFVRNSQMSQ